MDDTGVRSPGVGVELVNPTAGMRTVFRATAESTGGSYVEVEATYPPHSVLIWRTSPAMRTDRMFCDLWQVAADNGFEPDLLRAFEVVQGYPDEFCLC